MTDDIRCLLSVAIIWDFQGHYVDNHTVYDTGKPQLSANSLADLVDLNSRMDYDDDVDGVACSACGYRCGTDVDDVIPLR